jgi:hypothetical protein
MKAKGGSGLSRQNQIWPAALALLAVLILCWPTIAVHSGPDGARLPRVRHDAGFFVSSAAGFRGGLGLSPHDLSALATAALYAAAVWRKWPSYWRSIPPAVLAITWLVWFLAYKV